jgi:kanamycin nucleotidyltransferase
VEEAFRQPSRALVGGLYGSLARGTDTAWSDVDLLVLTSGGEDETHHQIRHGVPVSLRMVPVGGYMRTLRSPSLEWPRDAGILDALQVLRGDRTIVEGLLREARAVPRERFHAALKDHLPALMFESLGRLRSCAARGAVHDLRLSTIEVVLEAVTALCLLNGTWVLHGGFESVRDADRFPKVPPGFVEESGRVWLCDDLAGAGGLAESYVRSVLSLLEAEGIPTPSLPT